MYLVPIKPIQMRPGLMIDHCSGYLRCLHPVQDVSIQDVDNALSVDQNFGHSTVVDEHDDDQGIIMRKCTAKTSASENEISLLGVRGGPISTVGYLLIRALLM